MKKTILILLTFTLISSCAITVDDARKIKIGISTNELKYIMGNPYEVNLNNGYEEWHFTYENGIFNPRSTMIVIIKNDKVTNFNSY